jgi:hypothetical protein
LIEGAQDRNQRSGAAFFHEDGGEHDVEGAALESCLCNVR